MSAEIFPPPADWQEVPYTSLADTYLEPGMVVSGIGAIRDFGRLEQRICMQLRSDEPVPPVDYPVMDYEYTIGKRRVADILRPARHAGNIINGRAVLLPYNPQLHDSSKNWPSALKGLRFLL